MNRAFIISIILTFMICTRAFGQYGITDTIFAIEDIFIVNSEKDSRIGSRITKIESFILDQNRTKSLAELLNNNSTINIKSMGQGALSTASFRGTASNHTQVMWNGVSINSASIGSFDFSQIPIYFTDNVTLHHGSSDQQSGSGALGGSVNFTNSDKSTSRPKVTILSEYGSNNTITEGVTLRMSKNRFTSSTRVYFQSSDNDYRFLNRVYSKDPYYERRKEADYKQAGVMQEFYYKTESGGRFSLISWWQFDDRSLPQSTLSIKAAKEQITSHNIRTIATYEAKKKRHKYKITLAHLNGSLDYGRDFGTFSEKTNNANNSVISKVDYELSPIGRVDLGATINYRYDLVKSSTYEGGIVDRNSISSRVYTRIRAARRLYFDADVTLESVDRDQYAIYGVSAGYLVFDRFLTLKASNAYNHRVPTLNDLYWAPGGNPDLKPETGFSWDASILTEPSIGRLNMKFEATYYHMDIDNWIMWIPKGNGYVWSPVNFSKVISQGFEFDWRFSFDAIATKHTLSGSYGYAHSVDNSNRGDDAQGKQLPYIPRNKWNGNYEIWFKDIVWFNYNLSFTDIRFTTADQEYYTDAYLQHNSEIGGQIRVKDRYVLALSLRLDNIFDAYYESTQYFPMPLRMYRVKATFKF